MGALQRMGQLSIPCLTIRLLYLFLLAITTAATTDEWDPKVSRTWLAPLVSLQPSQPQQVCSRWCANHLESLCATPSCFSAPNALRKMESCTSMYSPALMAVGKPLMLTYCTVLYVPFLPWWNSIWLPRRSPIQALTRPSPAYLQHSTCFRYLQCITWAHRRPRLPTITHNFTA